MVNPWWQRFYIDRKQSNTRFWGGGTATDLGHKMIWGEGRASVQPLMYIGMDMSRDVK